MTVRTQGVPRSMMKLPRVVSEATVEGGRTVARRAARLIKLAKRPTHTVATAGIKVNDITHNSVEDLLRQQARMLEGMMDDSAQRLELAAEASGLRALIRDQVELLPDTRERLGEDARKTVRILLDVREELGEVLRDTVSGNKRSKRASTAKRAPGRKKAAARKASRKKVARKTTAKNRTTAKKKTRAKRTRKAA